MMSRGTVQWIISCEMSSVAQRGHLVNIKIKINRKLLIQKMGLNVTYQSSRIQCCFIIKNCEIKKLSNLNKYSNMFKHNSNLYIKMFAE